MNTELSRRISKILDSLKYNQVLVYIGDEILPSSIQSNVIVIRDSSPAGIEEVLLALQDSNIQLVTISDDERGAEVLEEVSYYVSGMATPIILTDDDDILNKMPVTISNGKVASTLDAFARLDYVLITRANQLAGKLSLGYNGLNKYKYVNVLDIMYKRKILECIDWLLGNNKNELNRIHVKDTSQFISSMFRLTEAEYVHNLLLNI